MACAGFLVATETNTMQGQMFCKHTHTHVVKLSVGQVDNTLIDIMYPLKRFEKKTHTNCGLM